MDKLLEEIKKIRKEIKELKKKKKLKKTKAKIKSKTKAQLTHGKKLREKKEKISTKYLTNPVQPAQIPMQINPNPYGDNLRQIARNYLAPAPIPVVPNNQLVVVPPQVPQLPQLPPPQLPRAPPPLLSARKKRKSRLKQAVIYDKKFLMRLTLKDLRLEIKRQFPGVYTDAILKKITGKNKEQIIDQYFKEENEEENEEEEEEVEPDGQDLYPNYFNQDDSAFAYVNPILYDSDVPFTSNRAFPSDMTPPKYPPKRHPLQTPIYEEDLPDVEESDDSEEDDDDDESQTINRAIKSVQKKITDVKAFQSPKGKSSQTPLSSDVASFGTQGAFSEPNFNDDPDYVKSFLSVLEDDAEQLKMIRSMEREAAKRRKKSKIPKLAKQSSFADEKEDNEDDNDDDNVIFPSALDS